MQKLRLSHGTLLLVIVAGSASHGVSRLKETKLQFTRGLDSPFVLSKLLTWEAEKDVIYSDISFQGLIPYYQREK